MPEPSTPARAGVGRRLAGIGIDWTLCLVISSAFFTAETQVASPSLPERVLLAGDPLATLGLWAVQHLVLVASLGTTIGHRLMGLKVVRDDGAAMVGVAKAAGRTVLLALVIPAVVWDREGHGLHDRGVGTRLIVTRGAQ